MKRSKFSLSNYQLTTGDMGELLPIGFQEVLPGDSFQHATSLLLRCSPLLSPVMHPVHVRVHHFFVPYRLIMDDWESFITGGEDGLDATTFPTIDFSGSPVAKGDLANYLGLPVGFAGSASALPFRAYALIFNEFYRDQDLTTKLTIDTTDGVDSTTNTALKNVTWEKDYFTTARDETQKGTEVSLPLGTSADIHHNAADLAAISVYSDQNAARHVMTANTASVGASASVGADTNKLYADLSGATAASISDLRLAAALQRYAEARSLYGARYTEYLRYLGIRPSDGRMQRPEYLGGGKQTIQFSEVLQTGVDSTDSGVADLKGHGIAALRSNRYRRFFEEHGCMISLLSVRPKTMYFEGLHRHWFRSTKEDFFQRELQHVGQETVYNKQIYAAHSTPDGVFGYQDRYDEYRRAESGLSGDFVDTTLNHWHLARDFSADPSLNSSFVTCTPSKRIHAAQTNDVLWIMAQHSIQARRMVHQFGTPGGVRL